MSENIREILAGILGEDAQNTEIVEPKWLKLMERAIVIELHISRWRARSKLTYDDLGLPMPEDKKEEKILNDLLSLGRKNLLPLRLIRRLDAIDSSARKALTINSTETYWGNLVSPKAYPDVKETLTRFQTEYFEALQDILDNWDGIRAQMRDEYSAQAKIAYYRMNTLAPGRIQVGRDEFVAGYVQRVLDMMPSPQTIQESFGFSWDLKYIPLPSLLAQDRAQAQQIEKQRRLDEQRNWDQYYRDREEARLELEMKRDVLDHARQQKTEMIDNFMRDLVVQLRGTVYNATTDVLESIQRNDHLHPRSVVQLNNLMDQVSKLNFFNDGEIDEMIGQIRTEMAQAPTERDVGNIQRKLQAVATLTRSTLLELGERPRSGRRVGVADVPTLPELRTARRTLEIAEAPAQIEMLPELRSSRIQV